MNFNADRRIPTLAASTRQAASRLSFLLSLRLLP
jgi:hypothetical protein